MQKIKDALSGHSERTSGDYSNTTSGNTTSGATTSPTGTGSNVHSGSTGVGSNIGRETSDISGGRGLGNAATAAGSTGTTGNQYSSGTGTGNQYSTGTGNQYASGTGQRESVGQRVHDKISGNHTIGHDSRADSKFDPTGENTHHDHKHLQAVTHAQHRHTEVEEVERQRDHQRHVHHLQHHVQPVLDTRVKDEVHHNNAVAPTTINERHVNTDEDVKLFNSLGEKHRDQETHMPKERTVVDLGEKVNTTTHHHVHHVTQPVVQQEIHNRHKIHTTIPLTHTVHEAPIIHKSSMHEPVHMTDFMKGGGKLDSGIQHHQAGLLATGDCDREVDGMGERMAQDLNLKPSTFSSHGNTGAPGLTGNSGAAQGYSSNTSGLSGERGTSGLTHERGTTGTATGGNLNSNTRPLGMEI